MKTFALALGMAATLVVAQDTAGLPECGVSCADTMLTGQTAGISCEANDLECLCQNPNFIYGLRDCSSVTCSAEDARQIVEFGIEACGDVGVVITTSAGGEPTATTMDEDASGSVSTILSTVSSVVGVTTTPVDTTTIGGDSESTMTEETATTTVSVLISTITSGDNTMVTTLTTIASGSEDATDTASEDSTATDGSATSTDPDGAAMPQRTIAPIGILAAGLAAFLL